MVELEVPGWFLDQDRNRVRARVRVGVGVRARARVRFRVRVRVRFRVRVRVKGTVWVLDDDWVREMVRVGLAARHSSHCCRKDDSSFSQARRRLSMREFE